MMGALSPTVPLVEPVLIFALAMAVFLLAPLVAERLRVPGIIGIIVTGIAVGPHGLNLLERGSVIALLGTVGLVYLMFLAGAELDLHDFRRNRTRSLIFGSLTFALPLAGALAVALALGYATRTSVLLGALFATQTLVAYPLVLRSGILRNEAVTVTIGATILTDVAVLLILAVVAASAEGQLDALFWVRLVLPLALVVAIVLVGLPRVARWFFRRTEAGGEAEFLFVMAALFGAAVLAELAGVEAIVGAFLAGLALNPLLPAAALVTNRVRFVGQAVFIPFFLLSVGMLVDLRSFAGAPRAWAVMSVLLAVAVVGKGVAAWIAARLFRFSRDQGWTMFGLSVSHAAAMMAVTLVGYELGIFDDLLLNTVVLIILVSCLIGPAVVARAARRVALEEDRAPYRPSEAQARVLVPLSNPATARGLLDLAVLLREEQSREPLFILTVVPEEGDAAHQFVASAEKMLGGAVAHAVGTGVSVVPLTRVEQNFARGIVRGMIETRASVAVLGWDGRTSRHHVFGSVLEHLLEQTRQQVLVAKLRHPLNTIRRLVVLVPSGSDHATGFLEALRTIKVLAGRLGAGLQLVTVEADPAAYAAHAAAAKPEVPVATLAADSWGAALGVLRELVRVEDLVVVLAARPDTVAWHPYLRRLPARLAATASESFILVYPPERQDLVAQAATDPGLAAALARGGVRDAITARSAHGVLDALLERRYPEDRGPRRDVLRVLLHNRRETALELAAGVVLVHARLTFLRFSQLYVGRCAAGVAFRGLPRAADLVVLLLSPTDQPGEHLAVLAEVARLVASPDRVAALRAARTEDEIAAALRADRAAPADAAATR